MTISSLSLTPNTSMAFTSTLRFSSVIRQNLTFPSTRLFNLRRHAAALSASPRFLSARPNSARKPPRKSKRENDSGGGGVAAAVVNGSGGETTTEERIVNLELHKEVTKSYMMYGYSVLRGRALPDVRDGLKPVHRRILYAMHELGLSSKKPFKKCARVVGEVLGKFHPHGDTAVYDSLVRMAQDFSLRSPLINGHGNFGSIDADPAAAMRYTECRLQALTEVMLLADLDLDTIDYIPNFDNSQKEPSVLPARLPNLLLNGSSGIAVGMATNIPPHNLGELVDALCALIRNPEASLQELLEYMPGPDFPTGGLIMGNQGILEAYRTGKGSVVVRGKTEVEVIDSKTKRSAVIINEVPYQTNKAKLIEKIAELVESKTLDGISDIRDESDRSGMRIFIELKRGVDPSIVLNNLYRLTALQSSFSCNMMSIVDGLPKQMGLKELLQEFLDFRCSVVERRAKYQRSQAAEKRHIVEGIVVALENLDGVISLIRQASNHAAARADLMTEFNLSDKQADAILNMNFTRLTNSERQKPVDECNSLAVQISKLDELLSSRKNILQVIEQEAIELKNKFATPRRSMLEDSDGGQLEDIDIIPNDEMLLAVSEKGYVKRMKPNTFSLQNRGTIGKSVGKLRVNDSMSDFIVCRAHDHVLFFSDRGIVYSSRAYKIPECTRTAAGTPLVQILSLTEGERITSIIPVSEFPEDQFLLMLTVNGYIKKVSLNLFSAIRSTGIIAIQLVPGDELKWVRCCTKDDLVAMASLNGLVILSTCEAVRALSRNTRGQVAMRLKEVDKIASMDIIPASLRKDLVLASEALDSASEALDSASEALDSASEALDSASEDLESGSEEDLQSSGKAATGPWLLFISESGHGKRVPLSAFKRSRLNRVGLIGYKFSSEDCLAAVFIVGFSLAEDGESDEQVVLVSHSGTVNRIKVRDISIQSRYARGVILMRLDYAGKIQSASLISATDPDPEELFLDASLETEQHANVSSTS